MKTEPTNEAPYVPLRTTARKLGVPIAWLRSEADASRVPHLRAGRRLLFNVAAVREALNTRAGELSTALQEAHHDGDARTAAEISERLRSGR